VIRFIRVVIAESDAVRTQMPWQRNLIGRLSSVVSLPANLLVEVEAAVIAAYLAAGGSPGAAHQPTSRERRHDRRKAAAIAASSGLEEVVQDEGVVPDPWQTPRG
jgi:hypothetical protein